MSEPTKQREGDQRLPDGGQECVQDLVIAAMEESKRVGTERYGSPLMTFNGRKGIQDIAEEARDKFVYLTQVAREAEADREQLIRVVGEAMAEEFVKGGEPDAQAFFGEMLAEVAVDRIMGWVVGQRMQGLEYVTSIAGVSIYSDGRIPPGTIEFRDHDGVVRYTYCFGG